MKKKINLSVLSVFVLFLSSCSNTNDEHKTGNDTKSTFTDAELTVLSKYSDENHTVSLEDATSKVQGIIALLDSNPQTKSTKARTIADIVALRSENRNLGLKSATTGKNVQKPDTLAYLFNFSNDMGYAIISADDRVDEEVLAITGDGKLEKSTNHPGLAVFLEGAEGYITESVRKTERLRDSLMESITTKLESKLPDELLDRKDTKSSGRLWRLSKPKYYIRVAEIMGNWETTSQVTPMLPVEWGQGYPFNEKIKYKNCSAGTTPTGCVATAIAQIMSYWEYPTNLEGKILNWNEMNQYTGNSKGNYKSWTGIIGDRKNTPPHIRDQVSHVMEVIGRQIGMDYSCNASGAYTNNAVQYLRNLGYYGEEKMNYNRNATISSISMGIPVLAERDSFKIDHELKLFLGIRIFWSTYERGHAWVIDGYIKRRQLVTQKIETVRKGDDIVVSVNYNKYYKYSRLIHNNWGWDGVANGYFASDSFNSNDVAEPSNTKSGQSYNYQYNNMIFPYIHLFR